jgi:hypothetical protein
MWSRCFGLALLVAAGVAHGDQTKADREATATAHPEVRRVWVLSDPAGYGSANRQREIVVYELVCEEGKMTKVSEGFETGTGPKFGEGFVLRTQTALSAAATQEQLQRAFADICGI